MSVGIGSSSHDFDGAAVMTLATSDSAHSNHKTDSSSAVRDRWSSSHIVFFEYY